MCSMNISTINILYANINSYTGKRKLINNYTENDNIQYTMFVETKTKKSNTSYRDWNILQFNRTGFIIILEVVA